MNWSLFFSHSIALADHHHYHCYYYYCYYYSSSYYCHWLMVVELGGKLHNWRILLVLVMVVLFDLHGSHGFDLDSCC